MAAQRGYVVRLHASCIFPDQQGELCFVIAACTVEVAEEGCRWIAMDPTLVQG